LLFAGTELGIYLSFNDGEDWQPLQFNLPVVSIRDIAIHGDDVVVATHGRSFWVLDDITPLREVSATLQTAAAYLYQPQTAMRIRRGSDQGTPYPPEIPHGANPPSGAIVDYYLSSAPAAPVSLEILDGTGHTVKRYASDDKISPTPEKSLRYPMFWIHPATPLAASPGMNRFLWDMHYASTTASGNSDDDYSFSGGPLAPPGQYTVRLTFQGKQYTRPLTLTRDPRVKATDADLQAQFQAASQCAAALAQVSKASTQAAKLNDQIERAKLKSTGNNELLESLNQFEEKLMPILGPAPAHYGPSVTPVDTDESSLRHLIETFSILEYALESADAAPTLEQHDALQSDLTILNSTLAHWEELATRDLPLLNTKLKAAGAAAINLQTTGPAH
jgi:hypothetical protein